MVRHLHSATCGTCSSVVLRGKQGSWSRAADCQHTVFQLLHTISPSSTLDLRIEGVPIAQLRVPKGSRTSGRSGQAAEERHGGDYSQQGACLLQQVAPNGEGIRWVEICRRSISTQCLQDSFQIQNGDGGINSGLHSERRHHVLSKSEGCVLHDSYPSRVKTIHSKPCALAFPQLPRSSQECSL